MPPYIASCPSAYHEEVKTACGKRGLFFSPVANILDEPGEKDTWIRKWKESVYKAVKDIAGNIWKEGHGWDLIFIVGGGAGCERERQIAEEELVVILPKSQLFRISIEDFRKWSPYDSWESVPKLKRVGANQWEDWTGKDTAPPPLPVSAADNAFCCAMHRGR
mmetsp:Transcript_39415/g.87700  ORF Transcript_39415/g.87700 Transcript_39415/m.87700 type:complete len:163 (+) Transcript_39415:160-648(+)|eukprot:CAMPEP_0202919738 /NCGR_PEP_ID=MMETSP1392-20130828/76482_1 /ASSEMBLY_ACC=CAM_ASM_000868 /TAXON_ID=225041 /ORGANISM="Chlamydomonas chlamydogama, Strain SAG 11-48b" /LENGTH=162 /DNA_ID=CAMNT_0049613197 /DNA_START=160 /DNA_END=648 /DNA_ORIENTATION=+